MCLAAVAASPLQPSDLSLTSTHVAESQPVVSQRKRQRSSSSAAGAIAATPSPIPLASLSSSTKRTRRTVLPAAAAVPSTAKPVRPPKLIRPPVVIERDAELDVKQTIGKKIVWERHDGMAEHQQRDNLWKMEHQDTPHPFYAYNRMSMLMHELRADLAQHKRNMAKSDPDIGPGFVLLRQFTRHDTDEQVRIMDTIVRQCRDRKHAAGLRRYTSGVAAKDSAITYFTYGDQNTSSSLSSYPICMSR